MEKYLKSQNTCKHVTLTSCTSTLQILNETSSSKGILKD